MLFAYTTTFTLIEWLAITGFGQGVLILVYILFRVRSWKQAALAITYFTVLTAGFGLQFALRLEDYASNIRFLMWVVGSFAPPLCYLMVVQMAEQTDLPHKKSFWVAALIPLSFIGAVIAEKVSGTCGANFVFCPHYFDWLYWASSIAGAVSMLAIFWHKGIFRQLWSARGGRERYWLVLVLVITNIGSVMVDLLRSTGKLGPYDADALHVTLGIGFIYLATTALFRVYPPPVQLGSGARPRLSDLNDEEKALAEKIRKLLELDKVYHEQTFSRSDLARELQCSENTLSRVVNVAFGRNFPKLLNEYRVEDAKRMLADPKIPIQVIASEVGFNSLASFNRVFKEVTGEPPSSYRTRILAA